MTDSTGRTATTPHDTQRTHLNVARAGVRPWRTPTDLQADLALSALLPAAAHDTEDARYSWADVRAAYLRGHQDGFLMPASGYLRALDTLDSVLDALDAAEDGQVSVTAVRAALEIALGPAPTMSPQSDLPVVPSPRHPHTTQERP